MATSAPDYSRWTKESLIKRIRLLEDRTRSADQSKRQEPVDGAQAKAKRERKKGRIDPSKYSTRLIALKLAYLGKKYNGFEFQASASVSTVEEELWKALTKSCLIFPDQPDEVDFGPWEYSKCGRTDRGVSAFGQVIGIRVRSARPLERPSEGVRDGDVMDGREVTKRADVEDVETVDGNRVRAERPEWHPVEDEIPYCKILNRLLPADIRVLAWCPNLPPDFSARFSCGERQYRYYFTQPAFAPLPSARSEEGLPDGWLDIEAMRDAAKRFEGLHDFRNFCKVDAGKQISNFHRRIVESDIVKEDVSTTLPFVNESPCRPDSVTGSAHPSVYYFHVRGSAFLWHQIRHMVAIVFLVGQGLESAGLVSELLDASKNGQRPSYTMADEVPLVLWDCVFPASGGRRREAHGPDAEADGNMVDTLDWRWVGEDGGQCPHGWWRQVDHMWEHWREKKMDEILANRLLDRVSRQVPLDRDRMPRVRKHRSSGAVFDGGNTGKHVGSYVAVMARPRLASPVEVNDRYAQSKGFADAADMTQTKDWRRQIRAAKNAAPAASTAIVADVDE